MTAETGTYRWMSPEVCTSTLKVLELFSFISSFKFYICVCEYIYTLAQMHKEKDGVRELLCWPIRNQV